MEYKTIAGNYYTITSKSGCTVTDTTGTLSMTVDAGGQLTVQAPSDKLVYDDEQAIVFKANFKSALAVAGLLGGGADKLPAGYTRLEFLESTGTQAIVLPVNNNNAKSWYAGTEVQFTALPAQNTGAQEGNNAQFQWGLWGSASGGASVFMSANNASGNLSLGKVGESWNSWTSCTIGYEAPYHRWGTWGAFSAEDEGSNGPSNVTEFVLFSVKRYGSFVYSQKVRKKWLVLKADGVTLYSLIPALNPAGEPCMYDRVSKQAFKNDGTGQFIAGMTLSQVRGLRLPAGGGQLTLSLPHEASIDKQAQAALEQARANGWELTIQYAEAEVPAGYRRLDFLESTGTQYIDTGVTLSNESEVRCEYELQQGAFTGYLYGACTSHNVDDFSFLASFVNTNNVHFYAGTERPLYLDQTEIGKTTSVQTAKNVHLGASVKSFSKQEEAFISGRTATIGCKNTAHFASARIYSFSISRAGEMQVDYVPCIAPDGKLGMYNKVDGTLQENAGSGAFIAGLATVDDVRKLWLPETGGPLTVSVPADTPDSAVEQLRANNPTWQIAIQYRES